MSEDAVREMFDHLLLFPAHPVKQLDFFICSNGGSGTVPWRLKPSSRICRKANCTCSLGTQSAATMVALGVVCVLACRRSRPATAPPLTGEMAAGSFCCPGYHPLAAIPGRVTQAPATA